MKGNLNLDDTLLAIFPEYSKSDVLDTHKSMVKKSQTPMLEVWMFLNNECTCFTSPALADASVSGVSSPSTYDICKPPPHTGNQTSDALRVDSLPFLVECLFQFLQISHWRIPSLDLTTEIIPRCSVGLRSGLLAGHGNVSMALFRKWAITALPRWGLALSSINIGRVAIGWLSKWGITPHLALPVDTVRH